MSLTTPSNDRIRRRLLCRVAKRRSLPRKTRVRPISPRVPYGETSRRAGCRKSARRFDERGWETGVGHRPQATAPILDSTIPEMMAAVQRVRFLGWTRRSGDLPGMAALDPG